VLGAAGCEILGFDDDWAALGLVGETVRTVTQTSAGLFAGTSTGVVYRFGEAAGWEPVAEFDVPVSAMVEGEGDGPRLLVGLRSGPQPGADALYASRDEGHTWEPTGGQYAGERVYSLAADPLNPARVFWGMTSAIARSDDGGRTWTAVHGQLTGVLAKGVLDLSIDPVRAGWVWAVQRGAMEGVSLVVSEDGGDTWTYKPALVSGTPYTIGGAVLPDPFVDGRVWGAGTGPMRSEDWGETWVRLDDIPWSVFGFAERNGTVFALGAEFRGDDVGELRVARLEGDRWVSLDVPGAAGAATAGTFDAEGRLVVATRNGVWRWEVR
jgi:hypothetical protein